MNTNITILSPVRATIKHSTDNHSGRRKLEVQSMLREIKSTATDLRCEIVVSYGSTTTVTINKHTDIESIIKDWFDF